jgi:hypothetical protein
MASTFAYWFEICSFGDQIKLLRYESADALWVATHRPANRPGGRVAETHSGFGDTYKFHPQIPSSDDCDSDAPLDVVAGEIPPRVTLADKPPTKYKTGIFRKSPEKWLHPIEESVDFVRWMP